MDMTGEYRIAAPRSLVWAGLNDAEVLRQSIVGCDEIDKTSDTEFTAKVTAKVGPVKARFGGKVTLSDIDPPNGYTITGEGSGGAAGFAKGGAKVALVDDGDGTLLSYTVQANVGGKLAQIGSRLIDATARKMAEDFFGRFAALMAGQAAASSPAIEPAAAEAAAFGPGPTQTAAGSPAGLEPALLQPALLEPDALEPAAPAAKPTVAATSPTPAAGGGLHPIVWIVGVVVVVGVLVAIMAVR
ncbi:MAG TPA: carbon monoxide dehydrogenase subunit G [Stellaceae bacterium]|nr:carbon monoxide dehydrogenase subunit G [Stellaceae bacterium]